MLNKIKIEIEDNCCDDSNKDGSMVQAWIMKESYKKSTQYFRWKT
jgi:hypothetical protein